MGLRAPRRQDGLGVILEGLRQGVAGFAAGRRQAAQQQQEQQQLELQRRRLELAEQRQAPTAVNLEFLRAALPAPNQQEFPEGALQQVPANVAPALVRELLAGRQAEQIDPNLAQGLDVALGLPAGTAKKALPTKAGRTGLSALATAQERTQRETERRTDRFDKIVQQQTARLDQRTRQQFDSLTDARQARNLIATGGAGAVQAAQLALASAINRGRPTDKDFQAASGTRDIKTRARQFFEAVVNNRSVAEFTENLDEIASVIEQANRSAIIRTNKSLLRSTKGRLRRARLDVPGEQELIDLLAQRDLPEFQPPRARPRGQAAGIERQQQNVEEFEIERDKAQRGLGVLRSRLRAGQITQQQFNQTRSKINKSLRKRFGRGL